MPKLDFLNVDLEMIFAVEPKTLLRDLGRRVIVLYSGEHPKGHFVGLELNRYIKDPCKALRRWLRILGMLTPNAKRELRKATSRTFDFGFEVIPDNTHLVQIKLPPDLLAGLAELGAGYTISLYKAEPPPAVVSVRKGSRK